MVMCMKCKLDLPYPKICVAQKNPQLARLLMHCYAGEVSEETAIHQYMYQSFYLKQENAELSDILSQIGEVEMRHLQMLGFLIRKLGVYPLFLDPTDNYNAFWSGKYICYETNLTEMFQANIYAEQKAIREYNALIQTIDDECVKEILKRIVLDERLHLEIFEKILASL